MEDLIQFAENFFRNLKTEVRREGNILLVSKVPESFEKFYGKKSPYELNFSQEPNKEYPNSEIISKNNFLISVMREFLENKGQTTLLKIDFEEGSRDFINKHFLFKNAKIDSINKLEKNRAIIRFTFQTTFQYLNEREQITTPIYASDGKLINFRLEDYKTSEGKKDTLNLGDIKKEYEIAKEKAKELIKPTIERVGTMLDKKLEKELVRINHHFSSQKQEFEQKMKELENQKRELLNIQNPNENVKQKITKIESLLTDLRGSEVLTRLNKEQEFFLKDETHKHSLGVSSKLINTTIILSSIWKLSCFLRNSNSTRILELEYDPLLKTVSKITCDCCKKEINKVGLCSSGHLSCESCLRGCSDCQKDYCLLCLNHSCFSCGKKLCRKCAKRCSKCHKEKCSTHISGSICETCREKTKTYF